jgi:histone H1/5
MSTAAASEAKPTSKAASVKPTSTSGKPASKAKTAKAPATKKASTTKAAATKKTATKKAAPSKATGSHPSWKDIIKVIECSSPHWTYRVDVHFLVQECIQVHKEDARTGVSRSTIKKVGICVRHRCRHC